ncbi:MAG: CTP synthase [Bacillales bacterium]|nr:CTP synthase [Bacillales bacterium]
MAKYIFVTGGVVSGLGKGIVAASLGRLLKLRGYKVAAQKFDPYMNIDPGTMNPTQHGEVFVTKDGAETDLDLGHYERFINEDLNMYSNLTSGKVYLSVINKERNGEYMGQTVQIIPHVTNEIKSFIYKNEELTKADIIITEIGGTTGDIESEPFLEAIRQFSQEVGRENCVFIHVCLVPYISGSNEYKSKPLQHSVKELQGKGIFPDVIVMRADDDPGDSIRKKIAMFCSLKEENIILNTTVDVLYEAPIMLHKNGLDKAVCSKLHLDAPLDLSKWERLINRIHSRQGLVRIGIVGKYVSLHDSYLSVNESLKHAGYDNGINVEEIFIDSETIDERNVEEKLSSLDGILVPGGFGNRGIEGMICACKYARSHNVPYFGICLGMQIAVIEFARNVCGIKNANSAEFNDNAPTVIDLMPDQRGKKFGGTMRLGGYPCYIKKDTLMEKAYKKEIIEERHRHRYEVNNDYRDILIKHGLTISGTSKDGIIVETIENHQNDFFLGVQFHPEFTSRPNKSNPCFKAFVKACMDKKYIN